jgi:hypothetical protein
MAMFDFLRKRKQPPTAEALGAQTSAAIEDIKAKWINFHKTVHLKDGVPLAVKMDAFIEPIHIFFEKKYPVLAAGQASIFFMATFTAILESNTYPVAEVNAAIHTLETKYSGKSKV